jgi:hypothetical protein
VPRILKIAHIVGPQRASARVVFIAQAGDGAAFGYRAVPGFVRGVAEGREVQPGVQVIIFVRP